MPVGTVCRELLVLPVYLYMYVCVSPQGVSIGGLHCQCCLSSGVGGGFVSVQVDACMRCPALLAISE